MQKIKYIFLFTALIVLGTTLLLRYYVFSTPPPLTGDNSSSSHSSGTANVNKTSGAELTPSAAASLSVEEDMAETSAVTRDSSSTIEEDSETLPAEKQPVEKTEKTAEKTQKPVAKTDSPQGIAVDDHKARAAKLIGQASRYIQRGSFEQAETLLRESLDLYKDNPNAWRQLTGLYRKSGDMDMELSAYHDWSRAMPGNTEALLGMADVHYRHGDYGTARELLVRTERETRELEDFGRIASLYRKMDDPMEEGRLLSDWKQRTPASQEARKHWAHYQRRQGDFEGALMEYGSLAQELPEDASLQRRMGDVYRNMGEYTEATVHYETAIALQPQNPGLLSRLAETRMRMHDYDGAVEVWSAIIELQPGTPLAESAQRQIDEVNSGMVEERQPW